MNSNTFLPLFGLDPEQFESLCTAVETSREADTPSA